MPVPVATKPTLTLELAKKIAAQAAAEAIRHNWIVVIAIVDDGANLVYLEKFDGAQVGSVEVAQAKARTSARFNRPSKEFELRIAAGEAAIIALPGALPIEGGLPLIVNNINI